MEDNEGKSARKRLNRSAREYVERDMSPVDKANASHARAFNRLRKLHSKVDRMNEDRKRQIGQWNLLFKKMLRDGRLTKEELAQYSPKRDKKQ